MSVTVTVFQPKPGAAYAAVGSHATKRAVPVRKSMAEGNREGEKIPTWLYSIDFDLAG